MTGRNGRSAEPPPPSTTSRTDNLPRSEGNFPPESIAYMRRRTAAFQAALSGKGLPMSWGTGIPRTDLGPKKAKGRKRTS